MTTDQATCDQRIAQHMEGREDDLARLFDLTHQGDDLDAAWDAGQELGEYALGVSARILVRVDLSTGGPADWVEAVCEVSESERRRQKSRGDWTTYPEPVSMTYHFADWFDHAERPVDEDSALWRYVADIIDCGVTL